MTREAHKLNIFSDDKYIHVSSVLTIACKCHMDHLKFSWNSCFKVTRLEQVVLCLTNHITVLVCFLMFPRCSLRFVNLYNYCFGIMDTTETNNAFRCQTLYRNKQTRMCVWLKCMLLVVAAVPISKTSSISKRWLGKGIHIKFKWWAGEKPKYNMRSFIYRNERIA